MKRFIKKYIPISMLDFFNKAKYSRQKSRFKGMTPEGVFSYIYENNIWGSAESKSGQGSTLELSSNAILMMNLIIKEYPVKSILDIPCGDFNWMQKVDLTGIKYLGCDLVADLISSNTQKYATEQIQFQQLDIINEEIPSADLIVVRDCFVHFSYEHINQAIENIKHSGSKYILLTTFSNQHLNYNITTGDWLPINLQKKPFNFPEPLSIMNEYCPSEFEIENRGKSLALWQVSDLAALR